MALTHPLTPAARTRRIWPSGPQAAFLRAAALGAGLVAVVALALPGAALGAALAVYALAAGLAFWGLGRGFPHPSLGLCNHVTLVRLALVAALVSPVLAGVGAVWSVFAVATAALALDGIDGWLARREARVSDFGARFDVEVDSLFALVLALNAALGGGFGWPAILLGAPRYLYAGAGLIWPWLRGPLPERFSRKAVCVLQLGGLIALQAPVLPAVAAALLVALIVAALAWSFAVDILWLWRRRA